MVLLYYGLLQHVVYSVCKESIQENTMNHIQMHNYLVENIFYTDVILNDAHWLRFLLVQNFVAYYFRAS